MRCSGSKSSVGSTQSGLVVETLMKRRDIILRAFRGTGVGIDVEGKERGSIRFPGFETYVLPEKDEEAQ